MAEKAPELSDKSEDHKHDEEATSKAEVAALECAVCLQTCLLPVKLPCGHIFCFLCVKGVSQLSKRCAMCRSVIPPDFLIHPALLPGQNLEKVAETSFEDGYQWFYEGRNGWWQYDERTSAEIENHHKSGDTRCEMLIAGYLYVIDFELKLQYRQNDPSRRRRIKRDLATGPRKGVAGIRLEPDHHDDDSHNNDGNGGSGADRDDGDNKSESGDQDGDDAVIDQLNRLALSGN